MNKTEKIEFRPLTLADGDLYDAHRCGEDRAEICWHSFPCLIMWNEVIPIAIAVTDGCAVLRYNFPDGCFFSFPFGPGDRRKAILRLRAHCDATHTPLAFTSLTRRQRTMLMEMFPGEFMIEEDFAYEDYIYRRDDLAFLKGTKYQKKRNHVHRFEAAGEWSYEPITEAKLAECVAIASAWRAAKSADPTADRASIARETKVLDFAFAHFTELSLYGGILRQRGRAVAFALGSKINDEMSDVNFEKALPGVEGAYAKINQQFAQVTCARFSLINREDDADEPNLRKAKLSYHPFMRGEKFSAFPSDITFATAADRPSVTALWREAFGDSEEFIGKFFEHEFTDETILVMREDGDIVAMGSVIPATVVADGTETPVRYIYALATVKRARGRGLATRILDFALSHWGVPLILYPGAPALREFYSKRGFTAMGTVPTGGGLVKWPERHVAFARAIGEDADAKVAEGMVKFPASGEHPDFSGVMLSLVCG